MPEPLSIALTPALIVEDIAVTRTRLGTMLGDICGADADIAAVGTLAAARASLAAQPRPFVLVDIGLPDGNGIELIKWLRAHHPQTTSVVVSAWGNEATVLDALRAGAAGYLFKERDIDELRAALLGVQRGCVPIDPFVARGILGALTGVGSAMDGGAAARMHAPLTERETSVLKLIERGCSHREIADMTGLARATIEDCVRAVYGKLVVTAPTIAPGAASPGQTG